MMQRLSMRSQLTGKKFSLMQSFQSYWEVTGKDSNKQGRENLGYTLLDQPKLVSQTTATVSGSPTAD